MMDTRNGRLKMITTLGSITSCCSGKWARTQPDPGDGRNRAYNNIRLPYTQNVPGESADTCEVHSNGQQMMLVVLVTNYPYNSSVFTPKLHCIDLKTETLSSTRLTQNTCATSTLLNVPSPWLSGREYTDQLCWISAGFCNVWKGT